MVAGDVSAPSELSDDRFRVAFDNAPIGMAMVDLSVGRAGTMLLANDALCLILGHPRDQVVGRTTSEFTHPDDVAAAERQGRRLVGRVSPGEVRTFRLVRRDGRVCYARVSGTAVEAVIDGALRRVLVLHVQDVTAERRDRRQLERLALRDTLTGLANRSLLQQHLGRARTAGRPGRWTALLLLDVDRFKLVNDSLGHQVGDDLLVAIADRLRSEAGDVAVVARLGGDEFVLLLEDLAGPEESMAIARRVLDRVRSPFWLPGSTEPMIVSGSIGVSGFRGRGEGQDLYREADLALYAAKDGGRDRVAIFDDRLRAQAEERMRREQQLRRALHRSPMGEGTERLEVAYQPVIRLGATAGKDRVVGAEALARIRVGPQLVQPQEFIDVAEDTGLVVPLDEQVMAAAAQDVLADPLLAAAGLRGVGVNLSARTLESPGIAGRLATSLAAAGVPGDRLRIEITETALVRNEGTVRRVLSRLRAAGATVGLDDFGTGYSALGSLDRFPLDFIKIDRSFVADLTPRTRSQAVLRAIVDLAHAHDLEVVAEGVETVAQLEALRQMGCELAQGFLLGRPGSVAQLQTCLGDVDRTTPEVERRHEPLPGAVRRLGRPRVARPGWGRGRHPRPGPTPHV